MTEISPIMPSETAGAFVPGSDNSIILLLAQGTIVQMQKKEGL